MNVRCLSNFFVSTVDPNDDLTVASLPFPMFVCGYWNEGRCERDKGHNAPGTEKSQQCRKYFL